MTDTSTVINNTVNHKFTDVAALQSCVEVGLAIPITRTPFGNCVFHDLPLNDQVFNNCIFENCLFLSTNFKEAQFENCTFYNCIFKSVNFRDAWFNNVTLSDCTFNNSNFASASLLKARFDKCNGVASIGPLGYTKRIAYAFHSADPGGVNIQLGCFYGPLSQALQAIDAKYNFLGKTDLGETYKDAVKLLARLIQLHDIG